MARVLIVEPRSSGCWLIDKAADLGHEVVVLSAHHGGRRVPDLHLRRARVEVADTNDDDACLAAVLDRHRREPFDAVVPGFEHYVPLAARLAGALGLPGLGIQAALGMRLKHRMREALTAAGVVQPEYAVVAHESEVGPAIDRVGLPCVVKPVDQSGSLNVRKVTTHAEGVEAFQRACRTLDPELGRVSLPLVLVEEFVSGPEYSVEGFVQDGRVHVLSVTKKLLAAEPSFVEVGHIVPGDLTEPESARVEGYVGRVAGALGLSLGPFHAEVRLAPDGPMLMEIGARLAGDRIPHLLLLSRGIDLCEITVRCHLGLPNPTSFAPADGNRAGVRYFLRSGLPRYRDLIVANGLRADPRLEQLTVLIEPGADVPNPDSSRGRLGYAIVTGPSYDDVARLLEEVDRCTIFR